MNITIKSSDHLGVFSSVACMLHCFATPLLFLSQAQTSSITHEIPFLWQVLNYIFLVVSFFAVYRSIQNSSNTIVKIFLFIAWFSLSFFIINEGLEAYHIPEFFTYSAAILLSSLHMYNLKYCSCKDEDCCVHK